MRTNLSSQISLNRVSPKYYKPENAVERSVLTRCEKVPTDIYETMEEGVQHIANEITAKIQERQREGKFCVIGAGTGASLRPLYAELVRKHKDEGLSFRNVVIFNLYEYYPLASEGAGSSFSQLNDLFLSQIDIDKQNVFTIDGTIPQEAVIEYCRLYEQRIQTFGGIDIVLMGYLWTPACLLYWFPHLFRKIISTCHNMKKRNLPVIMISLHGRSVRAADRLQRRQRRLQHRVTVSFRCIRSQRRRSFASKIHSIRWKG